MQTAARLRSQVHLYVSSSQATPEGIWRVSNADASMRWQAAGQFWIFSTRALKF